MALWPAADERPHTKVGYMAAPTSNCRTLKQPLANGEPSIHGPITTYASRPEKDGFWRKSRIRKDLLDPNRQPASPVFGFADAAFQWNCRGRQTPLASGREHRELP